MSQMTLPADGTTPTTRLHQWLGIALFALAAGIAYFRLQSLLSLSAWQNGFFNPHANEAREMLFHYSALPRCIVSILAGAALGLAGALFQHILRNPLADPSTLGVSAGSSLALAIATLWFPSMLVYQEWIALGGATFAMLLVIACAWRGRISTLNLILGGLVVSMLAGSGGAILTLFHHDRLRSLFIWSTGSLEQNNWSSARYLLPRFIGACALSSLLARPLSVLALDDENARSLGLPLRSIQILALSIAVLLSAFVVSAVGIISFIGLAAPALTRFSGGRLFRDQLVWSPILGAALLWSADEIVQLFDAIVPGLATGTATALLGVPLLLWMLARLRGAEFPGRTDGHTSRSHSHPRLLNFGLMLGLAILVGFALDSGQGMQGWHFAGWIELHQILHWRWPRVAASLGAGAMLGIAGTIIQRMTGNAMASPEVLGISSGASLGVILLILVVPFPVVSLQIMAAAAGAFLTLTAMLTLGLRSSFSPERMLLAGVAVSSAFTAIVALLLAGGSPRMSSLLSWMAGSTYRVTANDALAALAFVLISLVAVWPLTRWLDILPLGEASTRSVGVSLKKSRLSLLLIASGITGAATLVVGPLTFVGLIAPHTARALGLNRASVQLFGAATIGAIMMVAADWLGRNLLFPSQIPAGLLAAVIATPYFLMLVRRSTA